VDIPVYTLDWEWKLLGCLADSRQVCVVSRNVKLYCSSRSVVVNKWFQIAIPHWRHEGMVLLTSCCLLVARQGLDRNNSADSVQVSIVSRGVIGEGGGQVGRGQNPRPVCVPSLRIREYEVIDVHHRDYLTVVTRLISWHTLYFFIYP